MKLSKRIRNYFYGSYLEQEEKIKFVIRPHIFLEAKNFSKIGFFGILIPLIAWWLFPEVAIVAIPWMAIGAFRFVYEFFDWYYDAWVVTNLGIIQIMWQGFFDKTSSRTAYHIILMIGYEVHGFAATFFNYGTINMEAATGIHAKFEGAFRPKKKVEMLTRAKEEHDMSKSFRDHRALQTVLTDMLQQHVAEHGLPYEEED